MSTDLSEFYGSFFEESFEALDAMESELLNLNVGTPDPEAVNTIFRGAHSIKGGAGMFGFTELAAFTHVVETLLDEVRDGQRRVTHGTSDVLLRSVDCLREMLSAQQAGQAAEVSVWGGLREELAALLEVSDDASEQPEKSDAPRSPEEPGRGFRLTFTPHAHVLRTGNEPSRMFRALESLGKLTTWVDVSEMPTWDALEPEDSYLSWELTLIGDTSRSDVAEIFDWIDGECDLSITPLDANPSQVAPQGAPQVATIDEAGDVAPGTERPASGLPTTVPSAASDGKPRTGTSESSSIRVSIDKVDALINLIGELVITQSMLSRFGEDFDVTEVDALRQGLAQLARNTRELQESVMQIRMLPIKFSFSRFPRLVRDLSEKLGKKVELKLSGEHTELDKTVLEKISDPLVHVVRNALDHGIESPEIRRAAGKHEIGEIGLNAYHAGGNIVIEVSDDGAGINTERVHQKALAQGLIAANDKLTEEQVLNLLFHAGFSTADQVSDVSGRGVGMDVVRRNIKDLGGTVELRSRRGEGSTLTIRLPLTLAILDGQLVQVGSETYIIPLVSIVESLLARPERVNEIAGEAERYRVREEHIPVIRLYEHFGIEPASTDLTEGLLMVVETERGRIGLLVDDLLGQQQVVIKSLEANFYRVEGLSGATILGDGTVALILDIPGLVERYFERRPTRNLSVAA